MATSRSRRNLFVQFNTNDGTHYIFCTTFCNREQLSSVWSNNILLVLVGQTVCKIDETGW
jgi:hypothetical protein